MFDEELVGLLAEYRRYERVMNPFKDCPDIEGIPYIAMRKKQYDSDFMQDIRFKQFLSMPDNAPLVERLKVALFEEIEPEVEKKMEDTLNKAIEELGLGR